VKRFPVLNFGATRSCVAVHDLDSRGTADLVILAGEPYGPCRAVCMAGEDGAEVWSTDAIGMMNCQVHPIGDVTGDQVRDLVVVRRLATPTVDDPPVIVLDGSTGVIVGSWCPDAVHARFGEESLATVDPAGVSWCLAGNTLDTLWLLRIDCP
jgi:hypothetical protein